MGLGKTNVGLLQERFEVFLCALLGVEAYGVVVGLSVALNSRCAVPKSPSAFAIHSLVICFIQGLAPFDDFAHKPIILRETLS